MQSPSPETGIASSERRNGALEAAKWTALAAMTLDHAGKIVLPELFTETHLLGRIAYPLFAGIIGIRVAGAPHLVSKYVRRLLPWALVSQPVFVLAGRPWSDGNILFSLLLGVLACAGVRLLADGRPFAAILLLGGALLPAPFVEFGIPGVAMVPMMMRLASPDPTPALWLVGPVGVVANLVPERPPLVFGDFFALFATPVALASTLAPPLPRLPTHAFYAYYPAHLYALHVADLLLR